MASALHSEEDCAATCGSCENTGRVIGGSLRNKGVKPNQDRVFTYSTPCETGYFFGVFDGHGEFGHFVSDALRLHFCSYIQEHFEDMCEDTPEKLTSLFREADDLVFDKLYEHADANTFETRIIASTEWDGRYIESRKFMYSPWVPVSGGSTGTVVFVNGPNVTVANIGDSECVCVKSNGSFQTLTTDHCPSSLSEFNRIRALPRKKACALHKYAVNNKFHGHAVMDDRLNVFEKEESKDADDDSYILSDPMKVYAQTKSTYLKNVSGDFATYLMTPDDRSMIAMTRAFGDNYMKVHGMTSTPDISEYTLVEGDILVVASDGLWDTIKKEDFAQEICEEESDLSDLFDRVMRNAEETRTRVFGNSCDDTSIVIFR